MNPRAAVRHSRRRPAPELGPFWWGWGRTVLVIYNHLGYNQVRCLGDEVQRLEPGRGLVFLRRGLAAQEGGSSQKAEPATASHGTQVYGRRDCTAEKDLVGCPRVTFT